MTTNSKTPENAASEALPSSFSFSSLSQPQRAKGASLTIMTTLYNNSDAIVKFLSAFGSNEVLLQTFKDGGEVSKDLTTVFSADINKLPAEKLQTLNQQGAGIFFTVNATKGRYRRDAEVIAIRAFFVDMDGKEPSAEGLAVLPEPSIVVQSKNGKHLYWLLAQPLEVVDTDTSKQLFKSYQQSLANSLGGDPKVCDLARCMRLPGFNHMKDNSDPYIVEVLELNNLRYSLTDFPEIEEAPKPEVLDSTLQEKLHKIELKILAAKPGDRNNTVNKQAFLSASLVKKGLPFEEVFERLLKAAMYVGLDESEARVAVESGLSKGSEKGTKNDDPVNKFAELMDTLERQFGSRLKYNESTMRPELDGVPTTSEAIEFQIRREVAEDISKQDATDFVKQQLKENSYHPAVEWMKALEPAKEIKLLPELAKLLFNSDSHLDQVYVTRWFIGAVARLLKPGCQMDTALVLTGGQGIGKTSFLQAIASNDFFHTMEAGDKGKDELMVLHKYWILEMGELEATFSVKDVSALKSFLTKRTDTYRAPYERDTLAHPRRFVFAGSTNKPEFLVDDTGNRRFWVIDLKDHKLDIEWVKSIASILWSEAKALFLAGEPWWLTAEEQGLSNIVNETFVTSDPQEEIVAVKLPRLLNEKGLLALTTVQAIALMWGITSEKVNKKHSNQMGKIMRKLGYNLEQKKVNGVNAKRWFHESWDIDDPAIEFLNDYQFSTLFEQFAKSVS